MPGLGGGAGVGAAGGFYPPVLEGQPGGGQGGLHLGGPALDDAGAQEGPALPQQSPHTGRQGDDDIRHDVGQDNVPAPADSLGHRLVRQDVPHQDLQPVRADAVEPGVFLGGGAALVVNVHRQGGLRPQAQGRDGQNSAAAAQVQHPLSAPDQALQGREAQAGGGVGPGAEGEARVQVQRHPVSGVRLLPLGNHQQALPDFHGLVILLPVVLPVGVLHVLQGHEQGAQVRPLPFQRLQAEADLPQLGKALFPGLQIEGDPGPARHLPLQVLVHVVPAVPVVLQEVPEVLLVLNHDVVHVRPGQEGLHLLQTGVVGVNVYLQPAHRRLLSQRSVPRKNRATTPAPVWLPMTGPT